MAERQGYRCCYRTVNFTVEPPRMSQLLNAAEMGKVMFAQSGPNVSSKQMTKYTEEIRELALAMGGSVPSVFNSLVTNNQWPRFCSPVTVSQLVEK